MRGLIYIRKALNKKLKPGSLLGKLTLYDTGKTVTRDQTLLPGRLRSVLGPASTPLLTL